MTDKQENTLLSEAKKQATSLLIERLWIWLPTILLPLFGSFCAVILGLLHHPLYPTISLILLVILTGTTILLLLLCTKHLMIFGKLYPAYGVFWDKQFNMYCLYCRKLLKHSTQTASILYCSDPKCNNKHVLKNDSGTEITKQQAIKTLTETQKKTKNLSTKPTEVNAQEPEKINIWSKDSVLNHILFRMSSGRIKKCQNLKLKNIKLQNKDYWIAECVNGFSIAHKLHPSASATWSDDPEATYIFPKCPQICPNHIPIDHFKRHLINNTLP